LPFFVLQPERRTDDVQFPSQHRTGRWTVADIGGTHARLALWSAETGLGSDVRLENDRYASPIELLGEWFSRHGQGVSNLVLALAMPVGGTARTLTNRAWRFEPRVLLEALRLESLIIVNDFAAAAAGIDALPREVLRPLNPAQGMPASGVRLVLGPGTGLGVAAILADDPPRILASEAGHMTLASTGRLADRLLADGRARWGRVSWERALCGEGLAWIDALLRGASQFDAPAVVAHRADMGDADATAAVKAFSGLLGEFAGDACLAFQALAGVYLGGGVLHGIGNSFDPAVFLESFTDKGRFASQLRDVPCFLATGHELGLQGTARFLAGGCRMPAAEWRA
jgi:glucokinase